MGIKLNEQKRRDPINTLKTVPMGKGLRDELDELGKLLDAEELRPINSFIREWIQQGAHELREQLAEHIKNKAG